MNWLILRLALLVVAVEAGLRRHKPCINGDQEGDKCFCFDGWTGALCHRRMNCEGFDRQNNGSCVMCQKGWQGVDCDAIDCHGKGEPNYDETSCTCEKPYSGDYCETFQTTDIYSYYNNIVSQTGALGILCIVPLFAIYITCERCAQRRQIRRVEQHLSGTVVTNPDKTVNTQAVAQLLASDDEEEEEE